MAQLFRKKAAIYCRLSAEDRYKKNAEDDSESISNQKAMLTRFAKENGWIVYDIYSDDDYAGADRTRPEFNRLYADARAHLFDIVLCKSQSRFTREMELVEKIINTEFPIWGIRFIGVADFADTENPGNKKSRQINGLVNEWYLEDMSSNIKTVLDDKRRKGVHIGSFAPFGYQKDPKQKGHLIKDAAAAEIVKTIFNMYSQGISRKEIAACLNNAKVPTPACYKYLNGSSYKTPYFDRKAVWHDYTVTSILKNEVYIGNLIQGRFESISYKTKKNTARPKEQWIRVTGTHEAIISDALWRCVQERMGSRELNRYHDDYFTELLTGKAKCFFCGSPLYCCHSHGRAYLRCSLHMSQTRQCPGGFIPVEELKSYVLSKIVPNQDETVTDQCIDFLNMQVSTIKIGRRKAKGEPPVVEICSRAESPLNLRQFNTSC